VKFLADFHIHSKYSRATSKDMDLAHISEWAALKGIDLVGTGDFTHPFWLSELKKKLKDDGSGLFELSGTKFMLTTEICNIFHHDGKLRKVHTMIFSPSFKDVDRINAQLSKFSDLLSDGRPVFTIPAKKTAEMIFSASSEAMIVPCHIWTPWFSVLGSSGGFDSVEECFEEYTRNIYAVETGLSSDPAMNWRVSGLDKFSLISNSDAHSPSKIGREANIFDAQLTYKGIYRALKEKETGKLVSTVEFFPQEGKYHFDGHRNCKVCLSPKETKKKRKKCPKCGKPVTVGVMNRVEELADREEGFIRKNAVPFKTLVPLGEIIGQALGRSSESAAVQKEYANLVSRFGSELNILLDKPAEELSGFVGERTLEGILRVRNKEIKISPGYDGEYGTISIFDTSGPKTNREQIGLF